MSMDLGKINLLIDVDGLAVRPIIGAFSVEVDKDRAFTAVPRSGAWQIRSVRDFSVDFSVDADTARALAALLTAVAQVGE